MRCQLLREGVHHRLAPLSLALSSPGRPGPRQSLVELAEQHGAALLDAVYHSWESCLSQQSVSNTSNCREGERRVKDVPTTPCASIPWLDVGTSILFRIQISRLQCQIMRTSSIRCTPYSILISTMWQVTVLCPRARRCNLKVTPNTVLLQVSPEL